MIPAQLIVFIVVAVIGLVSGFTIGTQRKGAELAEARALYDRHRAAAATNTARWEAQVRAEESRRIHAVTEIAHAANLQAQEARTDAEHLDRVAGVLRSALIAAYAPNTTGPGGDAATTPGSSPATCPGLVLTDVFSWADPTLRELAQAYDRAHTAGLACERSYDALTRGTDQQGVSPRPGFRSPSTQPPAVLPGAVTSAESGGTPFR